MRNFIVQRWLAIKEALHRPLGRFLLLLWAGIAFWDTFISQFIPEQTAKQFPKMYQVLAMTTGWLPWWGWLVVGAFTLTLLSFEYAHRQRQKIHAAVGSHHRAALVPGLEWRPAAAALEAFGDKHILAARDRAKEAIDTAKSSGRIAEDEIREIRKRTPMIQFEYDAAHQRLVDCANQHDQAKADLDRTIGDLHADFVSKLRNGTLIAKGFRMPHQPGSVEVEVPTGEWRILWLDCPSAEAITAHLPTQVVYTGIVIREPA